MATNCDLLELVKKRKFREDLYYRLITFELKIEPIAHDKVKLKKSIMNELNRANDEFSKNKYISEESLQEMLNFNWPGNYRELKNTIDFLVLTSESAKIDFTKKVQTNSKSTAAIEELFLNDFHQSVELFESLYLKHVLNKNQGKVNETARLIGLSKAALIYKSKKYAINTWKIKANHHTSSMEMAA
jgi:transcriptional regulator with PAS, ATPase and Fis domain